MLILIISAALSILLFNNILYKVVYIENVLKNIRDKINNLNKKNQKKIRVISFLVIALILNHISDINKIDLIIRGIVFGLLILVRNLCFEEDLLK